MRQGPDRASGVLTLAAQTEDARVLELAAELSRQATSAARTVDSVCSLEQRGEPVAIDGTACGIGKELAGSGLRLAIDIGRAVDAAPVMPFTDQRELMAAVDTVGDAMSMASAVLIIDYCSDPEAGT